MASPGTESAARKGGGEFVLDRLRVNFPDRRPPPLPKTGLELGNDCGTGTNTQHRRMALPKRLANEWALGSGALLKRPAD